MAISCNSIAFNKHFYMISHIRISNIIRKVFVLKCLFTNCLWLNSGIKFAGMWGSWNAPFPAERGVIIVPAADCVTVSLSHSVTHGHTSNMQLVGVSPTARFLPIYDGCRAQPTVGKYQFSISDKHTTNKPTVFSQCPIPVFVWSKITSCAD